MHGPWMTGHTFCHYEFLSAPIPAVIQLPSCHMPCPFNPLPFFRNLHVVRFPFPHKTSHRRKGLEKPESVGIGRLHTPLPYPLGSRPCPSTSSYNHLCSCPPHPHQPCVPTSPEHTLFFPHCLQTQKSASKTRTWCLPTHSILLLSVRQLQAAVSDAPRLGLLTHPPPKLSSPSR